MARETLKDFLLNELDKPSADKISFSHHGDDSSDPSPVLIGDGRDGVEVGSDIYKDPNTGLELLGLDDEATGLLGDWVEFIQRNADVVYQVGKGNVKAVSAIRGEVLPQADTMVNSTLEPGAGGGSVFLPTSQIATMTDEELISSDAMSLLAEEFVSISNSGKFDDDLRGSPERLGDFLDKTAGKDGHYLLASVLGSEAALHGGREPMISADISGKTFADTDSSRTTDMVDKTYDSLREYNRHHPNDSTGGQGEAYAPNADVDWTTLNMDRGNRFQNAYGAYDETGEAVTTTTSTFQELGMVALSMMAKSAGYSTGVTEVSAVDGSRTWYSFSADTSEAPEGDASGTDPVIRIGREEYRARSADGAPDIGGSPARLGRGVVIEPPAETDDKKSYGAVNTPFTPATGPGSDAMVSRAAAAIVAVKTVISIMETAIVSYISSTGKTDLGRGPFFLGENSLYTSANARLLMSSLLVPTERDYEKCVDFGAIALFGEDPEDASEVAKPTKSPAASSPIFFHAMARSVLRGVDQLTQALSMASADEFSDADVESMLERIGNSRVVGWLNVLATIGNVGFQRSGGSASISDAVSGRGPFDVDKLPDGPSTRVSKSRSSDGFTNQSLAWRTSATPAIYMVPKNILHASYKLGTLGIGTNPLRGMMASSLGTKTYLDQAMEDEAARIPGDIVERLENSLDAEYVPFYFHDLRTNEIISFHAFLEDLTDSYYADFNETKGYGRIDAVQTYKSTQRRLSLTFNVAATSQEDFDEMWFKINKLVTLVYPQWTKGTQVSRKIDGEANPDISFIQPFSQILGATPLIRLRVGDVIKSNYSKFHLARIFGIGNASTTIKDPEIEGFARTLLDTQDKWYAVTEQIFYAVYGSPLAWLSGIEDAAVRRMTKAVASQFLTNGFANPLLMVFLRCLRDPDVWVNTAPMAFNLASVGEAISSTMLGVFSGNEPGGFGYHKLCVVFLRGTTSRGYVNSDGTEFRFSRPVKCMVTDKESKNIEEVKQAGLSPGMRSTDSYSTRGRGTKTIYTVSVIDTTVPAFGDEAMLFKKFYVTHSDLIADPNFIFNLYVAPVIDPIGAVKNFAQGLVNEVSMAAGLPTDFLDLFPTDAGKFMRSDTNAIVKSFNAMRGRGLAGVIESIKFDWIDGVNTWETDWNSRAPKFAKIMISFTAIHDLPPGIAHDGFNRAPMYNVGRIMDTVAGDVYDDNGSASKQSFRNDARKTFRATMKKKDK